MSGKTGPPPVKMVVTSGGRPVSARASQTDGGSSRRVAPARRVQSRISPPAARSCRVRLQFGRTLQRPAARLTSTKTGNPTRSRSALPDASSGATASFWAIRKPWLRRIPFGVPLEPEVKEISAGSSADSATGTAAAPPPPPGRSAVIRHRAGSRCSSR